MNGDIRLSVSYFSHPKIVKLRRRLGSEGVLAHLQLLTWTGANRSRGALHGLDQEDISIASGWAGQAQEFIATLLDLKLLDEDGGELSIHDWQTHNPWAFGAEERSAKASKAAKAKHEKAKQRKEAELLDSATSRTEQCNKQEQAVQVAASSSAPSPSPLPTPEPEGPLQAIKELGVLDPTHHLFQVNEAISRKSTIVISAWAALEPRQQAEWIRGAGLIAEGRQKGLKRQPAYLAGIITECLQQGITPQQELEEGRNNGQGTTKRRRGAGAHSSPELSNLTPETW